MRRRWRDGAAVTDLERAVLALEARDWRLPGAKEQAIRDELGLSPVRYYQVLTRLIWTEAAEAEWPVLVHRLRRIAGARRAG